MKLLALGKPIKKPPRSDERDGELFCGTAIIENEYYLGYHLLNGSNNGYAYFRKSDNTVVGRNGWGTLSVDGVFNLNMPYENTWTINNLTDHEIYYTTVDVAKITISAHGTLTLPGAYGCARQSVLIYY